jgi:hypothetical protein
MTGAILGQAWRVYRTHFLSIAAVAVLVLGGAECLQYLSELWQVHAEGASLVVLLLALPNLLLALTGLGLAIFSEPLFAALLEKLVDPVLEGRAPPPMGRAAREVPYGRLLVAELLLVLVVGIGLVLLVVPGLVALTVLGLAGPLVIAEGLGPVQAMRRSYRLLRPHLPQALLLVLAPVLVTTALWYVLDEAIHGLPPWGQIPIDLVFAVTLPAYFCVVLAALTVRLVHLHPEAVTATSSTSE